MFQCCVNFIRFVKVCDTLNSFHGSTFYLNSSLQEFLCFLCYLNTVELCFFEPPVKMEIGYRKLGVQRIRVILNFVLCIGLSCHFLVEKPHTRLLKNSDFRGRKISFKLNNQEVQRTRIPLIQYKC